MNIEQVAAAIRNGIDTAGQAVAMIAVARDHGRIAGALAEATCHDSRHHHLRAARARWTEAQREADLVIDRLTGCITAAHQYLEVIR